MEVHLDKGLKIGILVSIMFHGAIAFLPTFPLTASEGPEKIREVEIVERKIEIPAPISIEEVRVAQRPPVSLEKKPAALPQSSEKAADVITRLAEEVSIGQGTILPDLRVDLPEAGFKGEEPRLSDEQLRHALEVALFERLEKGTVVPGSKEGTLLPLEAPLPLPRKKGAPIASLPESEILKIDPKKAERTGPRAEIDLGGIDIKGPAAERRVVFRPPPIGVEIGAEADIELKFWVLPDGNVGRVVPLRKGDAKLEDEAMRYIKKWRFTPLGKEGPQEEQWGTVAIKFLLR